MTHIEQSLSIKRSQQQDVTLDCLHHMEIAGRFISVPNCMPLESNDSTDAHVNEIDKDNLTMEDEWQHAYDVRKEAWKQRAVQHGLVPLSSPISTRISDVRIASGTDFRHAVDVSTAEIASDNGPLIIQ